jgi:hypothetical protein
VKVSRRTSLPLGLALKISLQQVPGATPLKAIRPFSPGKVADAGAAQTATITTARTRIKEDLVVMV